MTVLPVIMGEVACNKRDGHLGYLLIAGLLVLFAFLWGARRKGSSVSVSEFWQERRKNSEKIKFFLDFLAI